MNQDLVEIEGRCLCGAVTVKAPEANRFIGACHCKMCQRWTGGALLIVDCGNRLVINGKNKISLHQTSAHGERGFCSLCGSGLYYHYFDSDKYFVPAGLFDFEGFEMDYQIFIDEKPHHYDFKQVTSTSTGEEFCMERYGETEVQTLDTYQK